MAKSKGPNLAILKKLVDATVMDDRRLGTGRR
jgi:hypothetical protein